jgi:hypothetical protein
MKTIREAISPGFKSQRGQNLVSPMGKIQTLRKIEGVKRTFSHF